MTDHKISSVYYFPIAREYVGNAITAMGYDIVREAPMPVCDLDMEGCDWYFILAKSAE